MQSITKECEVEVSYDKDGVKGAWYRAILEDIPTKSEHTLLRVRYKTLLKEDRSSHLSEIVDHSLIRPVPPKDDGAVLGEGSVVDAYYKGGWWSGLVVKKTEEDGTYLVSFDSPPDISYFERKQLRAHLDWSGSKWFRPETKVYDRCGVFVLHVKVLNFIVFVKTYIKVLNFGCVFEGSSQVLV